MSTAWSYDGGGGILSDAAAGAAGAAGDECESDHIKEAAIHSQERALVPLIEDAAEWLSKVTG